jgi:hypothetical protein
MEGNVGRRDGIAVLVHDHPVELDHALPHGQNLSSGWIRLGNRTGGWGGGPRKLRNGRGARDLVVQSGSWLALFRLIG